ncbi:MAG: ABC transporter permease [Methylacidiphilales bacterium]|nr:ABC transporter permease [Candidatus Methylacidiphilales bacterium]
MTLCTLIRRSLRFYWRTHLGVLAGVTITCAILTGALVVGDSVRFTLDQLVPARLGHVTQALTLPEHFFRVQLADDLASEIKSSVAPVLLVRGSATLPDGRARANDVQVLGVDERFWQLGGTPNQDVAVNARLAEQLGVHIGDTIVVRVEQPALVSRDAPLSGRSDVSVALRIRVGAIAGDNGFGRFSLQASQVPPYTVFVPLATLQEQLKHAGQANTLLTDSPVDANAALHKVWTLADAGLEVRDNPLELRTDRVFLDPAATRAIPANGAGVLTYFVNEISLGGKTTPYSFITAVGAGRKDNEITINSWLADDLGAKIGDVLTLRYYVIGERRELAEQTAKFRVCAITPLVKDNSWMPEFPGLSDANNCRDWEPGIPIDTKRIRPKDEAYWKSYRGTPKAFVTLAAGQKLWANRFGNLTAFRFPAGTNIAGELRTKLDPAALGLFFTPVRQQALAASRDSMDFGQLFIGFSLFLIVAALLLTAMLFVFNLEQRTVEIGLLRAIGFAPGRVRMLVLGEGFAIAVIGTVLGVIGGIVYTKLTLYGLATVWRGAVGAAQFHYHAGPATLFTGAGTSLVAAFLAMVLVQRRQMRRSPVELLAGGGVLSSTRSRRWGLWLGGVAGIGALALLPLRNAEAFFGAGACLLMAGIGFSQWWLMRLAKQTPGRDIGLQQLGRRNATRRRGRSLTTISVLAAGVFLLVAVNAFHEDARPDAPGTGGFALYAQSALPVYDDLNSAAGRELFRLSEQVLKDVKIVALRVRDGDEASCLNLNRAQQPRLLGVATPEFERRNAFGGQWSLLNKHMDDGAVPVIGDEQTVTWALGRELGDSVPAVDEHGRNFMTRIVAVLPGSILQGGLVMAEKNFVEKFPSTSGFRIFLIDAPRDRAGAAAEELSRGLQNRGLEVEPAWRRLAEFQAVENTYLGIFQALGGLGLLLGSAGLGIVVLRNVLERCGELALLQAVGFERRALRWLVLSEHWLLIAIGLFIGICAAVMAVLPEGATLPFGLLAVTLIGLVLGGFGWCLLATWVALRGSLLPALRNE